MGKFSRSKGARGATQAKRLLTDRDWVVDTLTPGLASGDLIGQDTNGRTWLIEVKNVAGILPAHKRQAIEQGRLRKLHWMLINKIGGTRSWLVQRQGARPVVWHEVGDGHDALDAHDDQ